MRQRGIEMRQPSIFVVACFLDRASTDCLSGDRICFTARLGGKSRLGDSTIITSRPQTGWTLGDLDSKSRISTLALEETDMSDI